MMFKNKTKINFMKTKLIVFISILFTLTTCTEKSKSSYKYNFETVDNDITNTLIYTLENGLKV